MTLCCADNSLFDDDDDDSLSQYSTSDIVEFEVDYGKAPDLYRLIERRNWDAVIQRCLSHRQEIGCWVSCRNVEDGSWRWNHLPIHAALVMQADIDVVKVLVNNFPLSLKRADSRLRLPLHLAMKHNVSEEVIDFLLEAYEGAIHVKDDTGREPITYIFDPEDANLHKSQSEDTRSTMYTASTLTLRKHISNYASSTQRDTLEKEKEVCDEKISQISKQYNESIEWVKKERDTCKESLGFEIKELKEYLDKSRSREDLLVSEKEDMKKTLSVLRGKNDSLEDEVKELKQNLEDSIKEHTEKEKESKALVEKLQNSQLEEATEKTKIASDVSDDLEIANSKIAELEAKLKEQEERHATQVRDLTSNLESMESVKSGLKNRLTRLTDQLISIEAMQRTPL